MTRRNGNLKLRTEKCGPSRLRRLDRGILATRRLRLPGCRTEHAFGFVEAKGPRCDCRLPVGALMLIEALISRGLLMTTPRARRARVLPRPACTPTAIRAVLAANASADVLQRYDQELDAAFEQACEQGDLTPLV